MTAIYDPVLSRIVLESPLPALTYDLAADLEKRGLAPVEVRVGGQGVLALLHGPGTPAILVSRLLDALQPIVPEAIGPDDGLAPGEVIVRLGDAAVLTVDVRADSPALLARAATLVQQAGLRLGEQHLELQDGCRLHHNGAPVPSRQLLRWALARRGLVVSEQEQAASSPEMRDRMELRLVDSSLTGQPARERFGVQVLTDDLDAGEALRLRLESAGFTSCQVALRGDEEPAEEPRFRLFPGPFSTQRAPADLAMLRLAF
jgi:hypothetical protein